MIRKRALDPRISSLGFIPSRNRVETDDRDEKSRFKSRYFDVSALGLGRRTTTYGGRVRARDARYLWAAGEKYFAPREIGHARDPFTPSRLSIACRETKISREENSRARSFQREEAISGCAPKSKRYYINPSVSLRASRCHVRIDGMNKLLSRGGTLRDIPRDAATYRR